MAPSISSPSPSLPLPLPLSKQKPQISVTVVELPPEHNETDLDPERARLRQHLALDSPRSPQPLFFIERAPETPLQHPCSCSLPGCTAAIEPGSFRVALNPGMSGDSWFRSSSDYYHPPCFEALADLTSPPYLNRIIPLTRNTFPLRGLKLSSVCDGSYLLPGGAERLILEWKVVRSMALDKRDGVFDAALYQLDPAVHDLLYRAGARGFWPAGRPRGLDQFEYYTLARTVAVNEEEWNLFDAFLGGEGREGERLSDVLGRWEEGVRLAWQESARAEGTEQALSPAAIKAIRRLSTIPIPQVGLNRFS
ncbi:hypothetical protein BDW62DRAFT_190410 [Aspergillus aurantiobrunneus]